MEKGPDHASEYTFRVAGLLVSFRRLLVGHTGGHLVSLYRTVACVCSFSSFLFSFLTYTSPAVEIHACLVVD